MHAVIRLTVGRVIPNVQASWVKLGHQGAVEMLSAGANDLGGVLLNESITRAAGAAHGQMWSPAAIRGAITDAGRVPQQRNTRYDAIHSAIVPIDQADALRWVEENPAGRRATPKRLSV